MPQAKPKTTRKPAAEAAKPPRKPRARKTPAPAAGAVGAPPAADREQMIRQTAYYRAEQRGFMGGSPEQDWLEAEREVDRLLNPAGRSQQKA